MLATRLSIDSFDMVPLDRRFRGAGCHAAAFAQLVVPGEDEGGRDEVRHHAMCTGFSEEQMTRPSARCLMSTLVTVHRRASSPSNNDVPVAAENSTKEKHPTQGTPLGKQPGQEQANTQAT